MNFRAFFGELEKLAIPDVLRRMLVGAGIGALGGFGYHGLRERTPEVQPTAWAQALDNEAPDLRLGEHVDESMKFHTRRPGELVARRGSAVLAEIPLSDVDVAGRSGGMSITGDASKQDLVQFVRDTAQKFGRTIDEEAFASKVEPALLKAQKAWWRR